MGLLERREIMPVTAETSAVGSLMFSVPDGVDTPALVVDYDTTVSNLKEMATLCKKAGVELLPHAKTHRTLEFGRLQLEYGAAGLSVATIDEAEAFTFDGAPRVFLTYPLVGEMKIRRVAALAQRTNLTLATDSYDGASAIGQHFAELGRCADLYLIIDSGMGRDGVAPGDAAALAREISRVEGVRLSGIFTHEGQVYRSNGPQDLTAQSRLAATRMVEAAQSIRADGPTIETVSLGASASVRAVIGAPGVTQVRPGIYAFNDVGQVAMGTATLETCAVRVLATVVDRPAVDRACIDAGSKALSSDQLPELSAQRFPGYGQVVGLPGWELHRLSEQHGWLRWTGEGKPTPLAIGQRVQVLPNHVCLVFFSLRESVVIRQGEIIGTWRALA
jgi:D-serine deaminase-like pyridoxal phosphate-dependent protein